MHPTGRDYRADIDGLRAVAVLAVLVHHLSPQYLPGGYVGVDVFFVISGYLIAGIISKEIQDGRFSFIGFYERRARRIFPALFVVLLASVVAGYCVLLPSDYTSTLRAVAGTVLFSSNIVFWREMAGGYFAATDAMLNPLLHTWSLGVEEQFYLIFPMLLLWCYRRAPRHITSVLIACAVVSFLANVALIKHKSVAVFFLSPFRGWELLAGALLATTKGTFIPSRVHLQLIAAAGAALLGVSLALFDSKTAFPGFAALLPVAGAALLIYSGQMGHTFLGALLSSRPAVYIGLISYSLYLWHWPVLVFVRYVNALEPITGQFLIVAIASILLASASYHWIEQPFRRKAVISRRAITITSSALASGVLTIAAVGLVQHGFAARFSSDVMRLEAARAPEIPFVSCEGRQEGSWCTLGADVRPTALVWGDSHSLAWAPALDRVLKENRVAATFITNAACPALFDVKNTSNPNCASENEKARAFLERNTQIRTVILAGYWSTYFRENGPISLRLNGQEIRDGKATTASLTAVLRWLGSRGIRVYLIGPVPVYERSVPLVQALEVVRGSKLIHSDALVQRAKHRDFYQVVDVFKNEPWFVYVDPISWLCASECALMKDGRSLYRDSHHLSVAGALAVQGQLSASLSSLSTRR